MKYIKVKTGGKLYYFHKGTMIDADDVKKMSELADLIIENGKIIKCRPFVATNLEQLIDAFLFEMERFEESKKVPNWRDDNILRGVDIKYGDGRSAGQTILSSERSMN